ncbi:alpha-sarcoglycan [Hyalella azteca]|uniref:Alpha-sarcoglycan n=1 Tax=Hyalella azteca TaxID=294128 RepID=A0A8B7PCP3_HYAAZ|nr:alpha-sarcoglycan [Hyalella azteca]
MIIIRLMMALNLVLLYPVSAELNVSAVGSQLLVIPLHYSNFSLDGPDVHYTASIAGLPDLPSWLLLSQSSTSGVSFLFGVPPANDASVVVEVIARCRQTYSTSRKLINVNISAHHNWQYGVSLKLTNLNLPELLAANSHQELLRIVTSDLWNDTPQAPLAMAQAAVPLAGKRAAAGSWRLHGIRDVLPAAGKWSRPDEPPQRRSSPGAVVITGLMPAATLGDRVPLRPDVKEGVYVSFGSDRPFSEALLQLQSEVSILLNRSPCPHYFKKTSYERYFRASGFAVDWCSFRLFDGGALRQEGRLGAAPGDASSHRLQEALPDVAADLINRHAALLPLMLRSQVPQQSYTGAVVETVVVPVVVMLLLVTLLTVALCCAPLSQDETATAYVDELIDGFPRRATLLELAKGRTPQHSLQPMEQRPVLRSRRSELTCGASLPGDADNGYDTAPDISSDAGPDSSSSADDSSMQLARSTPRRFEDYATLTRPAPPPYASGSTSCVDD